MQHLELADWRERTTRLHLSNLDIHGFRRERDELFASHPQSPTAATKARLRYFDPDPRYVTQAPLIATDGTIEVDTGETDGIVTYRRIAKAHTDFGALTLWWTEGYGGGLFLPFRDGTRAAETYGGGRYLTDTIKGTFGRGVIIEQNRIRLDFNYAYNPSCAYSPEWTCPLAPEENWLEARIEAGEMQPQPAQ